MGSPFWSTQDYRALGTVLVVIFYITCYWYILKTCWFAVIEESKKSKPQHVACQHVSFQNWTRHLTESVWCVEIGVLKPEFKKRMRLSRRQSEIYCVPYVYDCNDDLFAFWFSSGTFRRSDDLYIHMYIYIFICIYLCIYIFIYLRHFPPECPQNLVQYSTLVTVNYIYIS